MPPYKNKALGLGATILALGSVLGSASIANAATFNFSFSNEDGAVNGTVSGTIELPDGDGTFAASSVVVTSAPFELKYTTPFDVIASATNLAVNSFTVVGGMIDEATSTFFASFNVNIDDSLFAFNNSIGGDSFNGTFLTVNGDEFSFSGVLVRDNSTLSYSVNSPASTPEPTSIITLIGVGVLGVASKKFKKKA